MFFSICFIFLSIFSNSLFVLLESGLFSECNTSCRASSFWKKTTHFGCMLVNIFLPFFECRVEIHFGISLLNILLAAFLNRSDFLISLTILKKARLNLSKKASGKLAMSLVNNSSYSMIFSFCKSKIPTVTSLISL